MSRRYTYADFVRGAKQAGVYGANFQQLSPVYQRLKASPIGLREIQALQAYAYGEGARPGIENIIPSPRSVGRKPLSDARRESLEGKEAKYQCPLYGADDCGTHPQCFWKRRAQQCTKYRYGRQHRNPPKRAPPSPCTSPRLRWNREACKASPFDCDYGATGCRRKYGTSPKNRR